MKSLLRSKTWQNYHKLLTTITRHQITASLRCGRQRLRYLPQTVIPGLMPIVVVVGFEMININHGDG